MSEERERSHAGHRMNFYKIRPIEKTDVPFLWDSLYECIYVPEGKILPSRDILNNPASPNMLRIGTVLEMKDLLLQAEKINNPLEQLGTDSFQSLTQGMDMSTTKLLSYQSLLFPTTEAKE